MVFARIQPIAVALAVVTAAMGAPEPSASPKSWELGIAFHDPQRITLQLPGRAEPTTYWYFLYTVTNDTGRDVEFYPSFEVVTDTLEVIEGGFDISPRVYEAIKKRHHKQYPFFIDPNDMIGRIQQGEDHARTSAVAWELRDPTVNRFTLYVAGLSGEMAKEPNTRFDGSEPESADNARFYLLRKTLAITYDMPGDRVTHGEARPTRMKQEWVMR